MTGLSSRMGIRAGQEMIMDLAFLPSALMDFIPTTYAALLDGPPDCRGFDLCPINKWRLKTG